MEEIIELIGANNRYLIVFLIFALCDMLTGVISAVIKQELKSSKFREGLLKKTLEIIIIVVAFSCDWLSSLDVVGKGATVSLIAMEAWSILENIENYVPVPDVLKRFLESVKVNDSQN